MDSLQKMMQDTQLNDRTHTHIDTKKLADEQKLASDGSTKWKKIGNQHLAFKRYEDAISAYTKGIEEGDNSIDMLANRSCAYLHLSKYKSALADAEEALTIDKRHIKCIHRKVKALFGLALYRNAKIFLQKSELESIPKSDKKIITDLMAEANRYIEQSENADYPLGCLDFGEMFFRAMGPSGASATYVFNKVLSNERFCKCDLSYAQSAFMKKLLDFGH